MQDDTVPSCAVCTNALPVSDSVAPSIQHLPLTRRLWRTLLLLVRNWSLQMAHCARHALQNEGCHLPCYGREHNKWAAREVCLRFVKLDLVLDFYVIAYNYAFCNLIRALSSGSYPTHLTMLRTPDPLSRMCVDGLGTRLAFSTLFLLYYTSTASDDSCSEGLGTRLRHPDLLNQNFSCDQEAASDLGSWQV